MTEIICARAGCRELAVWEVRWRNPRIHTAERRKIWPACADHVDFLRDYLAARDFPVETAKIAASPLPGSEVAET